MSFISHFTELETLVENSDRSDHINLGRGRGGLGKGRERTNSIKNHTSSSRDNRTKISFQTENDNTYRP